MGLHISIGPLPLPSSHTSPALDAAPPSADACDAMAAAAEELPDLSRAWSTRTHEHVQKASRWGAAGRQRSGAEERAPSPAA